MSFSPVLSLIILENKNGGNLTLHSTNILVGVRDPITNTHHPNVLSVPTQRIPHELFDAILKPCKQNVLDDQSTSLSSEWVNNTHLNGHNPIVYAVESLFSQKLGLSESIHAKPKPCPFYAKPVWIERGCVAYAKGVNTDEIEPIDMLGILVIVTKPNVFPDRTGSYAKIFWTSSTQFARSYQEKDILQIDPSLNAVDICIHGLCVATAYKFLKSNPIIYFSDGSPQNA